MAFFTFYANVIKIRHILWFSGKIPSFEGAKSGIIPSFGGVKSGIIPKARIKIRTG